MMPSALRNLLPVDWLDGDYVHKVTLDEEFRAFLVPGKVAHEDAVARQCRKLGVPNLKRPAVAQVDAEWLERSLSQFFA
jgi:hypothetical protein